jgi:hypothetical protein
MLCLGIAFANLVRLPALAALAALALAGAVALAATPARVVTAVACILAILGWGFVLPHLNGEPLFVGRVRSGPRTLTELEQKRSEQRKAREQASKDEARRIAKLPRSAILFAEVENMHDGAPSLKQAAERLERAGGELELRGDELVITAPSRGRERTAAVAAARILLAGRSTVVEALRKGKGPLSSRLPDSPVRADGGVDG